jgi:diguanylate cyclase (GGDEF)-like protein
MSTAELIRRSAWIPTLTVLAVVLIAGARLIALSVQEHSARARGTAQVEVERHAQLIRSQLQELVDLAQQPQSPPASKEATTGSRTAQLPGVVWMDADGVVLRSARADPATVQSIVQESLSVEAPPDGAAVALLGPVRQGSQWFVAVRAPTDPSAVVLVGSGVIQRPGWTIAYLSLDDLLARAQLGRLVNAGYDLELSQREASGRTRVFLSSLTASLADPVTQAILPPASVTPSPAGTWTLAIQPRNGWYPASRLAASISLLGLVAWLLGLFVFDARRDSRRLQGVLTHSQQRLDEVNERLVTEIEERQGLQESLEHARYHDAFTGLPNRRYFMDQLDRVLRDVRVRRRQRFAVVLIDIDRFKLLTDTLGHTAGDEVMVQAARRFEQAMSALECVLARWDGQRFAVILFNVHSKDTALAIANLLQESLRAPFELRGHRLSVVAAMGVTHIESGLHRAEDVVREADVALSAAKAREDRKVLAYNASMGGKAVSVVSLEADLHVALARDEFRLLYQPIIDLGSNRIVGAEALLRWEHPVEGLLAPDKFLVIAEDTSLIVPITHWVVRRVCCLAAALRGRLPRDSGFFLSINLSAAAVRDPGLSEFVGQWLRATSLPGAALKFEVTEVGLISNPGAARESLARMHGLGVQLMLDDFGTGYSSVSHLQLFPFDYVKIDRPFVGQPGSDGAPSGVTRAIVQMVSSLGMHSIAERVESESAVRSLQAMGCGLAQGYFFSEPIEAEHVLRLLRKQAADEAVPGDDSQPLAGEDAGTLSEEDDSPTLVLPVMTLAEDAEAEWSQSLETVVIGMDGEWTGEQSTAAAETPTGEQPAAPQEQGRSESPAVTPDEEPKEPTWDPPTQPLAARTVAPHEERRDDSLAARLKHRFRSGQAR